MAKPTIDELWRRLERAQGETFETKTGKPFTFEISGNALRPSRTRYDLAKSNFEKALALVPFDGPGVISNTVRGPAYVWALLHDRRIRKSDW